MTIKDRILSYLKNQGISREDFYKDTGLSASNFKGVALNSELGGEKVAKILSIYRCISPDWLLLGEGPMLRSNQIQPYSEEVSNRSSLNEGNIIYKMYQDQLKIAQEEKEENKTLIKENGRLEERICALESKLQEYEPSSNNPKGLEFGKNVKSADTKRPSLTSNPSASYAKKRPKNQ